MCVPGVCPWLSFSLLLYCDVVHILYMCECDEYRAATIVVIIDSSFDFFLSNQLKVNSIKCQEPYKMPFTMSSFPFSPGKWWQIHRWTGFKEDKSRLF